MRISGAGAAIGALVGFVARGAVVFLNLGVAREQAIAIALPSAGIGLLVGAIAGAVGRPLIGAAVGAVLSGFVFELFMFACASLIGAFSPNGGRDLLSQTLIYALEMALAGALAGFAGGLVARVASASRRVKSAAGVDRLDSESDRSRS